MTKRLLCVLTSAALVLVMGAGCGDESGSDDDAGSTYTLSGTLTKAGVAGVRAYLKLVAWGAPENTAPLYFTSSSVFSNGTASYTITGVTAGRYYGYAFIDMNGNAAGGATSIPDIGDYTTGPGEISVHQDTTAHIPDGGWELLQ